MNPTKSRPTTTAVWAPPRGAVTDAGGLAVRTLGTTGSTVVLLHGLVGSGRYWGAAYNVLADHHRLVVPDLLGFGRSPRPATGYTPDDHANAVVACLDALGIDDPVTIGAHSLGGLIALRLAASHPGRVAGIVAFGPPLYPDPKVARAHIGGTGTMGRLIVLPGPIAHAACAWVCGHRRLAARLAVRVHPELPAAIAADGVQHTWASYSQTVQHVLLAADGARWLDDLTIPVRLVAGDSDPVVDLEFLRRIAEQHGNVHLDVWAGGHNLPLLRADDCAAVIADQAS